MTTFGLSDSSDDELDQPLDEQQPDVLANANASIRRWYDGIKSSILEIRYVNRFMAWINSPEYPAPQLKNISLTVWRVICVIVRFVTFVDTFSIDRPTSPAREPMHQVLAELLESGQDIEVYEMIRNNVWNCVFVKNEPKAIGQIVHDWSLARKVLPEGLSRVYDLEIFTILIYTIEYGLWYARRSIDPSQRPEFERSKSLIAQEMSKIKGLHYQIPSDVVKPKLFGVLSTLMFDDY